MNRLVAAGTAGILSIVFAACGGGDASANSGAAPAPAPAPAPAAAPATAPPAAPAAATPTYGSPPEGATEAMLAEGDAIFHGVGLCFSCHGPTGQGMPQLGANLTDDTWFHGDGSYDFIIHTIETGVPEPKEAIAPMMPRAGTTISDEQVRAVAAYVWSLSHH